MLIERSGVHEQFFIFSRRAQIHAYRFCFLFFFFLYTASQTVFLLLTSVTALFFFFFLLSCHVRRKKYIPVRKCQEAAAIVGTMLWKRVRDAPSLCLPLVLPAPLFLFFMYSQHILFPLSHNVRSKRRRREEPSPRNQPETQKNRGCTLSRCRSYWGGSYRLVDTARRVKSIQWVTWS